MDVKSVEAQGKTVSNRLSLVSTSSSTTQAHLLPSGSSKTPATKIESRLFEPISAFVAAPDDSLNTSASCLSAETCPVPATSNKFTALSIEVQPPVPLSESANTKPNSELSNTSKVPQNAKQNLKKRKRTQKYKN
ncbi:uncharacterized protein TNCV_4866341 [Trichonephila clavipes]|nr:uncharacterized protein TNCV_4866341 [Trichonephila clavipes]